MKLSELTKLVELASYRKSLTEIKALADIIFDETSSTARAYNAHQAIQAKINETLSNIENELTALGVSELD